MSDKVPVTLLTGFLGAGKTTLLNYILSVDHGKRIAVIENEFGEIGIDHELVINCEEEIFEMNNGCICCTVRGDLIRILSNLMKRRNKFDHILIETTGLADPGPVAQTFFMDAEIQTQLKLDGIVTLVDARHIDQHLDAAPEALEQIAFADVILLNKCDLVESGDLESLETRLRQINSQAALYRTEQAEISLDRVLGLGGFDLERALQVDQQFLEPEYPFEWGGLFRQPPQLELSPGPDPTMQIAFFAADSDDMGQVAEQAVRIFSGEPQPVGADHKTPLGFGFYQLSLDAGPLRIELQGHTTGTCALMTEHHPEEFSLCFSPEPVATRAYKPDHEHDEEVSSVGVTVDGELDGELFQAWISKLLREKGQDIFRSKGVVSIQGQDRRVVFQGVHMLLDSQPDKSWGDSHRQSQMVFIGRNLDREGLTEGVLACRI